MIQEALFSLDTVYRPQRPLCSNQKDGHYKRRDKQTALNHFAYIEANPLCLQSLVVADVDYGNYWEFEKHNLPAPSWRTYTHFDDSYHAVWALTDPVILTDAARRPPVNLLARVEAGLRRALTADTSYGGRITKNPLSSHHHTTYGINNEYTPSDLRTYSLRELADYLDYAHLLPKSWEKQALKDSGVGRNVTLFDTTRHWGYRAVKRYWDTPYTDWAQTVYAYAHNKNLSLISDQWGTPLPTNEVRHLANSISKWIWRRFSAEQFSQIQQHRIQKRWGPSTDDLLQNLGMRQEEQ